MQLRGVSKLERTLLKISKWTRLKEGIHTVCPKCSLGFLLNKRHIISDNGEVNPSYLCPRCNFHTYITLEDWSKDATS